MQDRSRDVSYALTEARTVLSRAETAMDELVAHSYTGNMPTLKDWVSARDGKPGHWTFGPPSGRDPDPDTEAMYYAMERVVRELSRWRKAGKRKRR